MKHSADKRSHFFTAIVCAHLASITAPHLRTLDRKLFAKMSYTMLCKAVADAAGDDQQAIITSLRGVDLNGERRKPDPTSRALQTAEDVALAVAVFRSQGRTEEALKLLDETRPSDVPCTVSIQSWSLMLERIELLEIAKKWSELQYLCKDLLNEARAARGLLPGSKPQATHGSRADDWKVWRAFALSAARCPDPGVMIDSRSSLRTLGDMNKHASQLAAAEFLVLSMGEGDDESSLIEEITLLFISLCAKRSCYQHVIRYASRLSALGKLAIVRDTSSAIRMRSLEGTFEVSTGDDENSGFPLAVVFIF